MKQSKNTRNKDNKLLDDGSSKRIIDFQVKRNHQTVAFSTIFLRVLH